MEPDSPSPTTTNGAITISSGGGGVGSVGAAAVSSSPRQAALVASASAPRARASPRPSKRVRQLEQQSQQLNTLFSDVLRTAEERIEHIIGEQVCIDLDVESVTDKSGRVDRALSTLSDNHGDLVFGRLERALALVCANPSHKNDIVVQIEEISIKNMPGASSNARRCEFADGVFTYYGAFGNGERGCLTERQLQQYIEIAIGCRASLDDDVAVRQDYESPPSSDDEDDALASSPVAAAAPSSGTSSARSSFTEKVLELALTGPPVLSSLPMPLPSTSPRSPRGSPSPPPPPNHTDERTPLVPGNSNNQVVDETCCAIL